MAPLPSNSTNRVFFDYTSGTSPSSKPHTIALRTPLGLAAVNDVQMLMLTVLQNFGLANFAAGWRVISVRWQGQGTEFSIPVTLLSNLGSFVGAGAVPVATRLETVEETFQGRSLTTGRRVDFSLYRARQDVDATFRVEGGSAGLALVVKNVVQILNDASGDGTICCIDGSSVVFGQYMNQNYNSYWERRLRS